MVPDDDQFLVVRTTPADSLVEQGRAAGVVDRAAQVLVLLRAERRLVAVRSPKEGAYVDAAARRRCEQLGDRRAVRSEQLVGVAAPVGEPDEIARAGRGDDLDEAGEVR